uniref:Retrovirus-related Pol polyprotein from transposon TNT 1-94 n=1 Tax=Cajanus cajan TaxID=3821 RepID=A0A151R456_CAJCA|nr:hypothetical protein KK1_041471 [Cajanus cajan]
MQVLNLMKEFEIQKMKETETIKQYSDKLLGITNKVRLLGTQFLDSRIVEKILVTIPERYEASITALENTKDLSKITLAEVLHALQALEQKRLMREEGSMEGVYLAKWKNNNGGKNKKKELFQEKSQNNNTQNFPPCPYCKKTNHPQQRCWWRPDLKCEMFYVPDINQNLLSVTQLLGKGYKVLFEDKNCVIKDIHNKEVFNVHMKGKSFALNLEKEEPIINEDTSEEHKDACLQKKFDDQEENEDDEKSPSKEKFKTNAKVVSLKKDSNKNHKKEETNQKEKRKILKFKFKLGDKDIQSMRSVGNMPKYL